MGSPRVSYLGKDKNIRIHPPPGIPAKRYHKERKGSSTSGRSKGIHPQSWIKVYARRNRSHKYPNYNTWCKMVGTRKTGLS